MRKFFGAARAGRLKAVNFLEMLKKFEAGGSVFRSMRELLNFNCLQKAGV